MHLWTSKPHQVIIVDFEFENNLLKRLKHEAVYQVAIANACGDWVVPPVVINHGMLVSELEERRRSNSPKNQYTCRQITKFYGSDGAAETAGLSWEMIGDLLDTYTKVGWRKAYLLS
jgi:hypothetical protein